MNTNRKETGFSKLLKTENLRNRIFQTVTLSSEDEFMSPMVERFDYLGNKISEGSVKNPLASSWLYGYDNSLRLFKKIERYSIMSGASFENTYDYYYDKEGRLIRTELNREGKQISTERRTYLDKLMIIEGNPGFKYDTDIIKIHYDDFGREVKREEWSDGNKITQIDLYYDGQDAWYGGAVAFES